MVCQNVMGCSPQLLYLCVNLYGSHINCCTVDVLSSLTSIRVIAKDQMSELNVTRKSQGSSDSKSSSGATLKYLTSIPTRPIFERAGWKFLVSGELSSLSPKNRKRAAQPMTADPFSSTMIPLCNIDGKYDGRCDGTLQIS